MEYEWDDSTASCSIIINVDADWWSIINVDVNKGPNHCVGCQRQVIMQVRMVWHQGGVEVRVEGPWKASHSHPDATGILG